MDFLDVPEEIAPNLRRRFVNLVIPFYKKDLSIVSVWVLCWGEDNFVSVFARIGFQPGYRKELGRKDFEYIISEKDEYLAEFFLCRMNKNKL